MPVKTNNKTVSRECEKYQLDLTDYITGDMTFLTKKKQQQLFDHLRQCASCRQDFFDWEETFGVLVTKQHHSKAEVKKRMDDLIERLKRESVTPRTLSGRQEGVSVTRPNDRPAGRVEPLPGEKFLNHDEDIGNAAVKVWHHLYKNGKIKVNDLKREVKLPTPILYQALGWLARENQIHRTRVKKSTFTYLAPEEIQKHQAQV